MEFYTVKPGDTIYSIAGRYGLSVSALLRLNPHISDANRIHVGQQIRVREAGRDDWSPPASSPSYSGPKWFSIARAEEKRGIYEWPGDRHNPEILKYHRSVAGRPDWGDEIPWCSSFVNWCIETAGYQGTNSAQARSWLNWGRRLSHPAEGCIAVFSRNGGGHVGFYVSETWDKILVLGGNQGQPGGITYSEYTRSRLLDYRWPA